ncbi:MAG: hypothetical protein P9E67_06970, partial [Candidatus Competibacter sp.]|nr:hypothetical protein [Candidatus Competibacter sp.]
KPARVRSANRNRDDPTNRNNNQGFRLASPPAFQSRRVHGCDGREARVIMSPLPGLARTGAPNSLARNDRARGRRFAEGSALVFDSETNIAALSETPHMSVNPS